MTIENVNRPGFVTESAGSKPQQIKSSKTQEVSSVKSVDPQDLVMRGNTTAQAPESAKSQVTDEVVNELNESMLGVRRELKFSIDKDSGRAIVQVWEKLGIGKDVLVFIVVANLIPYKGHVDIIKAFAQIQNQLPNEWALLCVGRDDGIGAVLRDNADELGIASNIRWLGERLDVPGLLLASDVGLLGSHQEGFSNSLLEYMAAELPVIATDVGGNSDAVVDSITGFLVRPNTPSELAAAIGKIAADKVIRANMGREGKRRVNKLFSHNNCVKQYVNLYGSVADSKYK